MLRKYKVTLTSAFLLDPNENDHPLHEFCSSRDDDEIHEDISVRNKQQKLMLFPNICMKCETKLFFYTYSQKLDM